MAARQSRAISQMPSHLTHVSNAEVRQRLGAGDVVETVKAQAKSHALASA